MNRKLFISLGLVAILSAATNCVMAGDSTIYTDDLGRMHFLGRDAANSSGVKANYSNSEQQDLTRKLYEESANGVNYVDRPFKNYDHTFGADKLDTQSVWKNKFSNNVDEARVNLKEASDTTKGSFTAEKGVMEATNPYVNGGTNLSETEKNVIKSGSSKKHWWQK